MDNHVFCQDLSLSLLSVCIYPTLPHKSRNNTSKECMGQFWPLEQLVTARIPLHLHLPRILTDRWGNTETRFYNQFPHIYLLLSAELFFHLGQSILLFFFLLSNYHVKCPYHFIWGLFPHRNQGVFTQLEGILLYSFVYSCVCSR